MMCHCGLNTQHQMGGSTGTILPLRCPLLTHFAFACSHSQPPQVSTYDKPFCLKSPEERAVPPCAWKEYFSDGKPYYSDGKQSSWTMPEEYRDWKAKTEAAEKRKLLSPPQPSATSAPLREKEDANKAAAVVYATPEEAAEAFAELLAAKGVSATAKMKDVADICGRDPRWEALR